MDRCPVFRPTLRASLALSAFAVALPAPAAEATSAGTEDIAPLYRLIDPAPLISARWQTSAFAARLEGTAWIAPRHELRFSSTRLDGADYGRGPEGVSFARLSNAPTLRLDPYRATYRYTFLEQHDWRWKVGVSASLRTFDALRPGLTFGQRPRLGSLPQVHIAGEGRLADKWRLAFDADSPTTLRGRSLDLGVRVSYALSPNFSLYGGYRLSDPAAEGDDAYAGGLANSASVGMRLRF
ncbi:MAG: hypothetical protein OHK0044_23860 [Burkholderiaceae bacterium]